MKYVVVLKDDLIEFEKRINDLLTEGWEPQGGISITAVVLDSDGYRETYYAQALIKRERGITRA